MLVGRPVRAARFLTQALHLGDGRAYAQGGLV